MIFLQLVQGETTHAEVKVMIPIKRNHSENHVISRENPPKHQGNHQETISSWERYKTYEKRQSRKYKLSGKKRGKE